MTCCRCNRNGACRNCVCVREGKRCTSCLPKRLGSCSNVASDRPLETQEEEEDLQDSDEEVPESKTEDMYTLPPFSPAHPSDFTWGEMEGAKVVADIDVIYSEIVHWRHNLFKIPSGKQGKMFVHEMARLFNAYAEASSLEGVAIKAAMVLPALVLQKPSKTSRSKDHCKCIERRMKEWQAGHFQALFEEAKSGETCRY